MGRVKIGNVYPSNDYLLARCAPAGYGLGVPANYVKAIEDANNIFKSGYYLLTSTTKNTPFGEGMLHVLARTETECVQEFFSNYDNSYCRRTTIAGSDGWGEFEWENPPLYVGLEYRTTERWQGKPVYYKVVDFGGLPNATTATVPIGAENIKWVFLDLSKSWAGPASNLTTNYMTNWANITEMIVSNGQISITTNANMTGTLAYITVKYTKTTD